MTQKEHRYPIWSEHSGFKVKPSAAAGFEAPVRCPRSSTTTHMSMLAIGHREDAHASSGGSFAALDGGEAARPLIAKDACLRNSVSKFGDDAELETESPMEVGKSEVGKSDETEKWP
jgi:hypothetical protein